MTSNHHAPYVQGYTRATMVITERSKTAKSSKPQKDDPSSDCRLKLAYMKLELLVIANQNVAVNAFPGLVHTARHTMGVWGAQSQRLNRKERAAQGKTNDWGEVVTRQPYRKVRLDHLLSREKINCCLVLKVQPSKEEKEKIASIFEYKKHQKAKQQNCTLKTA